jgi:IS1 family transposase
MSQDTSSQNQNTSLTPKKNNNWIFIAIIALLSMVVVYLLFNRSQVNNERDMALVERDSATLDRDNIRADYDAALARLDELTTKNAAMDSAINNKDGEIAQLKKQIQSIIKNSNASEADLKKARGLIATLKAKVKGYEERIAELEHDNSRLTNLNETVSKERDSAVTENVGLQQKVRLGRVLHASNIRLEPINLKRGGKKEVSTSKAKRMDVFRIQFDIDDNRIAEDGVKELYIRIVGPGSTLLSNAAYGSGISSLHDGQTLEYTLVKQINLKQGEKVNNITVDWNQEGDYAKGTYTVEIFNDGFKIGSNSITLR